MQIEQTTYQGVHIAEISSDTVIISQAQDAVELLGNCYYQGIDNIVVHETHLVPAFFDLKTGIAGDVLQKFSTYQMRLAIVGDFSRFTSNSLRDFIFESNKMGRILFVSSVEQARELLAKQALA